MLFLMFKIIIYYYSSTISVPETDLAISTHASNGISSQSDQICPGQYHSATFHAVIRTSDLSISFLALLSQRSQSTWRILEALLNVWSHAAVIYRSVSFDDHLSLF